MTVAAEVFSVRLEGVAPLLTRSARLVDPLDGYTIALDRLTRKRNKTEADHREIGRVEWKGGLWVNDGRPSIPAAAIESCLVQAARHRRRGQATRSGVVVRNVSPMKYDGPSDLDKLCADPRFSLRVPVRIRGNRLMRTRPMFPTWSVDVAIAFLPSQMSRQDVLDDLVVGGDLIGIGDWRPRFGRFRTVTM